MTSILNEIIDSTRLRVAESRRRISVSELMSLPGYHGKTESLASSLDRGNMNIVAEIKRNSPSAGSIRKDTSPVDIAVSYQDSGAAAISVLTEPEYFGGSLKDLESVSERVDIPVLQKDFIVDEYQIHEAKARGADAILLIVRVLDSEQLSDLHDAASELGLDVLVELYDRDEIEKVNLDQVKIVGANNRDLSTMQVDINRSISILADLPPHIVKVSESGISVVDQVKTLLDNDIHAALIGESLMRHPNPGDLLKQLLSIDNED